MAATAYGRSQDQLRRSAGKKSQFFSPPHFGETWTVRRLLSTSALVTDVGNNWLCDMPIDPLLGWVEACLDRLAETDATSIVTQLPRSNLRRLGDARLRFFRERLLPSCRLPLCDMKGVAGAVGERLVP